MKVTGDNFRGHRINSWLLHPLSSPSVLVWVPLEADAETRIQVAVVYLGGILATYGFCNKLATVLVA